MLAVPDSAPLPREIAVASTKEAREEEIIPQESSENSDTVQAKLPEPKTLERLKVLSGSQPSPPGSPPHSQPSSSLARAELAVQETWLEHISYHDLPHDHGEPYLPSQSHFNSRGDVKVLGAALDTGDGGESYHTNPKFLSDSTFVEAVTHPEDSSKSVPVAALAVERGAPSRELLLEKAPGVLILTGVFNQFIMRPKAEGGNGKREAADVEARAYISGLIADFWTDLLTDPPLEHRRKRPLTLEVE